MNNRKSFLTAILIVALICVSIFYLFSNRNNVSAQYTEGQTTTITELTTNKYLYCMDWELPFKPGKFYCYETGEVDPVLAYIVERQEIDARDPYTDVEANAIWHYFGAPEDIWTDSDGKGWELLQKAYDSTSVTLKDSGNIKLSGVKNGDMLAPDNQGRYGPFRVDYPTDSNGKLFGNIRVLINNNQVYPDPESGKDFYLTEADGINPGGENIIEFYYSAARYTGTYAKFSPSGADNSDGQNLIYIEPEKEPINESEYRTFRAGKPNIIIDLDKKDPSGEALPGAVFQVAANGGTIISGVNSSNEFTTAAGGNRIEIKPNVNVNDVLVTISEKQAPDGYIKIDKDLVIYYKWDSTKNMWTETHKFDDYDDQLKITSDEKKDDDKRVFYTKLELENRRKYEIKFNKVDPDGNKLSGAKFKVEVEGGTFTFKDGSTGDTFVTGDTDKEVIVIEPDKKATSIKIKYTETEAPAGFAVIEEPIEFELESTDGGKTWTRKPLSFSGEENVELIPTINNPYTCEVRVENRRKIVVDLIKTDTDGQIIQGVQFDLNVTNGELENTKSPIVTDENGKAHIEIIPASASDVTLTLKETNNKYYVDMPDIEIKFIYRNGAWETDSNSYLDGKVSISYNADTKTFELTVKNQAKIEKIKLIKVNKYDTTERIEGIEFTVTLENAVFESNGTNTMTRIPTNSNGEIELGTILIDKPSQPVKITVTEDAVPTGGDVNYKKLDKPVVITLTHRDGTNVTTDNTAVSAVYDVESNVVEVTIENEVTMSISGRVWEDIEHGTKPVTPPNGYRDSDEAGMEGIMVEVVSNNFTMGKLTEADGTYKFENLPASSKGTTSYTIKFSYDGINYIAVEKHAAGSTSENDSDVDEIDRDKFNDTFYTIEKDVAISRDGSKRTELKYNSEDDGRIAKLDTKNNQAFQMNAKADGVYSKNTEHIDMGLKKKVVDLAALTEIKSAKVSINGKNNVYSYDDILGLEKDENGYPIIESKQNQNAEYNLYLYESDYNYRIGDYLGLDNTHSGSVGIKNSDDNLLTGKAGAELDVELTYQILLNNQNATTGTVNKIAYYYDTKLSASPEIEGEATKVNVNGVEYKKIIIPVNSPLEPAGEKSTELSFRVNKNMDNAVELGVYKNWVEIISYSTDAGCIDKDSAPDNILNNIKMSKHEDDTDDASGLNIKVQENIIRTLNGNVFNDLNSDGFNNEDNNQINDVIVQLIEIKNVDGDKLEYIWQETVTGSKSVKALSLDGRSVGEYTVDNTSGNYYFEGFIPGDYIVRFIYGDDEYYDTTIDRNNIEVFNGQDYKSTKLPEAAYNKLLFNEGYFAQNASMARDNEARRLEVMKNDREDKTYASVIEKLADTWMCAETSFIKVPVSDGVNNNGQLTKNRNINFGLMRRTEPSLEIEKHIKNLTVDDVVNATAKIENNTIVTANGMVEFEHKEGNVQATTTDKNDNRIGKWLVQTDIGNLSGKVMTITYQYIIKNVGGLEHIGNKLLDITKIGDYIQIARENQYKMTKRIEELTLDDIDETLGDYIGTSYFTNISNGSTTNKDKALGIKVQVEDYLAGSGNNQLILINNDIFDVVATDEKNVWTKDAKVSKEGNISVIRTKNNIEIKDKPIVFEQTVITKNSSGLDTTGNNNDFTFRSYAAQLIGDNISSTGKKIQGLKPSVASDVKVQSYADTSVVYINKNKEGAGDQVFAAEPNEFVAETVVLTIHTGGTDPEEISAQSKILKIAIITASSMAIIALGIILIKRITIKK